MLRMRAIAAVLLPVGLLGGLMAAGCAPSNEEVAFNARKAVLERQIQGTRELIALALDSTLVQKDRFLVGIDEKIIEDLLRSQLPIERPVGKRLIVRLERAAVLLHDKFGLVTIEGKVHRAASRERGVAVRVHGGLEDVQIDPVTDQLRIRIAIDQVEVLDAGILDKVLGRGGKKFISEKGREVLKDELPVLRIPVGLAHNIRVPAIQEGTFQLDSLVVPLDMSVERVLAAGGRLWITLNAEVGQVTGGEEGLGVEVRKKRKPGGKTPAGSPKSGSGRDTSRGAGR